MPVCFGQLFVREESSFFTCGMKVESPTKYRKMLRPSDSLRWKFLRILAVRKVVIFPGTIFPSCAGAHIVMPFPVNVCYISVSRSTRHFPVRIVIKPYPVARFFLKVILARI